MGAEACRSTENTFMLSAVVIFLLLSALSQHSAPALWFRYRCRVLYILVIKAILNIFTL